MCRAGGSKDGVIRTQVHICLLNSTCKCMLCMVLKKPMTSCMGTKSKVPLHHPCLASLILMGDAMACSTTRCSMTAWQVLSSRQMMLARDLVPRLLKLWSSSLAHLCILSRDDVVERQEVVLRRVPAVGRKPGALLVGCYRLLTARRVVRQCPMHTYILHRDAT